MMGEVVDDGDAVDLRFHFETALYALECFEGGGDFFFRNAVGERHHGGCGCVPDVVFAGQGEFEIGPGTIFVQHGPGGFPGFQF